MGRLSANPTIARVNGIWVFLLASGFLCAVITGRVSEYTAGAFSGAQSAVEIALKLAGVIILWLGLMRIADKAGLVSLLARAVYPALRLVFPDVPREHPALPAIAMNIAANALGLDNAATPLGIKAMEELEKLNPKQGVLTDAQAMLVAINTAGVSLIPVTVI
ncbi:MAG: nucleoside recognition domain-containing protein, partial [Myxococcales bacterium]